MKIHKGKGNKNYFTFKIPKVVDNEEIIITSGDVIELNYNNTLVNVMFVIDDNTHWLCLCERWNTYEIWR